jgi:hypothetical protein
MHLGGKLASYALAALLLATFALSFAYAEAENNAELAPAELVRRAVNHEISSNGSAAKHFMFKDLRTTPQLSQLKLLVETNEATAGLLIMQNGHPLNEQQRQEEESRLANYAHNPQELRKKKKQEREDAEHTERILKALPSAFIYQPAGTVRGREGVGAPGDELLQLNFRPNPNYNPPSHVEQVLTGMHGHLLVDASQERIAEIDATLQSQVEFGWGILGHLDPGGRFLVEQADVGEHHWELTHMELSFTGKVLFFKKLSIHSSDTFSDFRPVPNNLTFAQGVELLKKEAAENHSAMDAKQAKQKSEKTRAKADNKLDAKDESDDGLCCNR